MKKYFELPHLNCQLLEIDTLPYNIPVQQLQMPFEPFADVDFYGVIMHDQLPAQTAKYMDLNTNEVLDAPILEFIGTIPHRPK